MQIGKTITVTIACQNQIGSARRAWSAASYRPRQKGRTGLPPTAISNYHGRFARMTGRPGKDRSKAPDLSFAA